MGETRVTTFRMAGLEAGARIRLLDGTHGGDWLVAAVGEGKVRLRCPVSGREIELDGLTDEVETLLVAEWPVEGPLSGVPAPEPDPRGAESQLIYRMLVDQSPLSICIHQDGLLVLVNPATLALLGAASEKELLGRSILEFVHPEDRAKVIERVKLMNQGYLGPRTEERFLRLDGSTLTAEATAAPITFKGRPAILVMVADVTERKNLENALERAQEIAHLGSWTFDPSTARTVWSKELYRIFGVTPQDFDLFSGDFFSAIHTADVERVREELKASHGSRTRFDTSFRIIRKGGGVRYLAVSGEWGFDAHGHSPLFMGTAMDVTEKTLLEAELGQAQKMEALGTLAGGVAHDFNNILSAVLGYAELSYGQAAEGSSQQKYIGEVLKAGRRARDLVRQILAFSRKTDEKKGPVDVAEVVGETLGMLRATIPTNIAIVRNLPAEHLYTWGSPSQLQQVVTNLMTNAYQAVKDKGGSITIEVSLLPLEERRQLTVGEVGEGDYIVLTVTDTGEGIPYGLVEKIFDPFFTTKSIGEGTGLGLSVVHGIVSSMGGGIEVRSRQGQGASFSVYLPEAPANNQSSNADNAGRGKAPRGLRILVVDDERSLADLGQTLLETMGHKAEVAYSAEEALTLVGPPPGRFDLLITDQTVPGMTGLMLIRKLRASHPAMATILCTGYSEAVNDEALAGAGVGRLLMKPFAREKLEAAIAEVVSRPRP